MRFSERIKLSGRFASRFGVRRGCAAVLACALLAAACGSSSDDGLPPLGDDPESSDASSEVEVAEADDETAAGSDETTSSTEQPVVTAPLDASGKPVIEIPTEWDSELDEIFGRYQLYRTALDVALGPPEADPGYLPLKDLMEEVAWEELSGQIQDFRDRGLVLVFPEESLTDHVVRLPNPSVLTKTEGNEVVIQDCWVDDGIVETLEGEVQESYFESSLRNVTMKVIDGEWRTLSVVTASEESSGYQECRDLIDELS